MINLIGISGRAGSGKDLVASIIQYLVWRNAVEKGIIGLSNNTLEHFTESPLISKVLSKWKVVKFADKLKDIVCLLTGCAKTDLEGQEFKKSELPEIWHRWELCFTNGDERWVEYYDSEEEALREKKLLEEDFLFVGPPVLIKSTYRDLLQYVGTDLFRNQFHPNTWVNATFADYKKISPEVKGNMSVHELFRPDYPQWIISDVRFPNELKAIKDRGGICIRVSRPPIEPDPHISESALDDSDDFDYMIINSGTIDELVEKVKKILIKEKII